jgi:hypothetical protein
LQSVSALFWLDASLTYIFPSWTSPVRSRSPAFPFKSLQPNQIPRFQTISIRFQLDVECATQLDVSAGRQTATRATDGCTRAQLEAVVMKVGVRNRQLWEFVAQKTNVPPFFRFRCRDRRKAVMPMDSDNMMAKHQVHRQGVRHRPCNCPQHSGKGGRSGCATAEIHTWALSSEGGRLQLVLATL